MQKTIRGDITLTIDGEELTLTPSFKAIASIEAATGKPMGELIGSIASLHVTTVATVLFQAMRANGYTTFSYEKVGDLVADSLSDPKQPLLKAALEFVNGYFGRKQEVAPKKPVKSAKVTG